MVVVIMEGKHHSPHLKKVLHTYKLTAANTMSGPSSVLSRYNSNSNPNDNTSSSSSSSCSSSNSNSPAGNVSMIERPYQASVMIKPESGGGGGGCGSMKSSALDCSPGSADHLSTSLLHQHLKQQQQQQHPTSQPMSLLGPISIVSPKAATTPQCLGPVKKEFLSPREESHHPPTHHGLGGLMPSASSSFVQVRRSSGGANEIIANRTQHQGDSRAASTVASAFICRSNSNPGHGSSTSAGVGVVGGSHSVVSIGNNSSCSNHLSSTTSSVTVSSPNSPAAWKTHHLGSHLAAGNNNGSILGPKPPMKISSGVSSIREVGGSLKSPPSMGSSSIGPRGSSSNSSNNHHPAVSQFGRDNFPTPSQLPPPILSAPDRAWTEKKETVLEKESIACFVVGGEKRLCFPQILTSVLRGFQLHQINQVCDELQIFCSRCSNEQLEVLKLGAIIPVNAPSCGLITKTDAERLVNALLHRNPPKSAIATPVHSSKDSKAHIRVYHKCFGKAKGIIRLHEYTAPEALCIECENCHGLFSPARFVAHSHDRSENRTCHWGFDSANWRHYLMLNKKYEDPNREAILKDFKMKFDHKRQKESRASPMDDLEDQVVKPKKVRCDPNTTSPSYIRSPASSLPFTKMQPFHQYISNDQSVLNPDELERVKKMLVLRLGREEGEGVNMVLDAMAKKISALEQICRSQAKLLHEESQVKAGVELQTKVNTMEAELQSLKKQLLRRHVQSEEI